MSERFAVVGLVVKHLEQEILLLASRDQRGELSVLLERGVELQGFLELG